MDKPIFSQKIICSDCNKKHKAKKARGKRIYVCSTYDNYGKEKCNRNKLDQEEIIQYLIMRFKNEDILEILPKIELIEVSMDKMVINIFDDEPIISTPTFKQF